LAYFKDVGVEIHQVQMNSMALCNYAVYDQLGLVPPKPGDDEDLPSGKCVAVLEIGAELTNLVISDGNKIILQRTINVAGNSFTKALTKDLKLTFAKAEHLKRNATKSLPKEGPDLKTILTSLRPVFNDLQNEVQRSLTYFQNAHRSAEITKIVGLGNAFHLPGLQRFLQEKLQIEIQIPKAFEKVTGAVLSEAPFKENILTFAVAYGLAIQG
jgi:type IV pilus assembly protein PilM